ncbi:hypothetical protein K450DRAFT_206868 [Umbelopsis ramanniana AG]|uniref:Sulfate transporter n=1 Tax=Umbelopsis ramanniana AG TaxID=1314678 RepID=A0AAD5HGA9_UMBRA|nr:uncharacterized protein K450DRAFT_206868 [Umbelopsis ramanniana AG]KAI8581924.1 hypothetical protein K450DRAFT_206868 [Umbelopsis ramanniana AG]
MRFSFRNSYDRFVANLNVHELSGSLGDLGTLLPLMISLAVSGQINLTSTLWFGGIWNIVSGLIYQVPICVQPMKALGAVALSSNMSIQQTMAAGLGVGGIIFFLGATKTIHMIGIITPKSVIKGIQLGTGVTLMIKAHDLVKTLQWTITGANWADNFTWVLLAYIFVIGCYNRRVPSALILFLIGLTFALVRMFTNPNGPINTPRPGGHYPDTIIVPSPDDFKTGFLNAGLGQIPLTALNSVIALSVLIDDLFPEKHATTTSIAMSVGLMNLIGCWFGSMPFCHGSGGLAGQYRFGARSEVSIIILGLCKLLLGIVFGGSLVGLLKLFPNSLLSVMLFVSGLELATAARSVNDKVEDDRIKYENFLVMLITMGSLVAFSNDGIGFLTGMVGSVLLAIQRLGPKDWYEQFKEGVRSLRLQKQNTDDHILVTSSNDLSEETSSNYS